MGKYTPCLYIFSFQTFILVHTLQFQLTNSYRLHRGWGTVNEQAFSVTISSAQSLKQIFHSYYENN